MVDGDANDEDVLEPEPVAEIEPAPVEDRPPEPELTEEPPAEPEPEPIEEPEAPAEPEIIHPPEPAVPPPQEVPPAPAPPPVPPPVPPSAPPAARRQGLLRRVIVAALIIAVFAPPLSVVVYSIMPPPITELMVERLVEGYGIDYQWRPLSRMSPALADAAVASEDGRFCSHHGFDFDAMQKAMRHNERRPNKIKGGSTISQQTAKNVFLWPGRSYVRKAIEAWYTVLIETLWGKRRIMEVYLNVVEFGPGVYGAQAASQHFFHVDASRLSPAQAARLIAVLPRPLKYQASEPGPYVAKRTRRIDGAIGTVREDGLAGCVGR